MGFWRLIWYAILVSNVLGILHALFVFVQGTMPSVDWLNSEGVLKFLPLSSLMLWILNSMVAMTQVGVSAHQLSSSSFTTNALPKSKTLSTSVGFWIGFAGFMLGFLALYIGILFLPRFVNLIVAGRRSYEEGFLQIREVEGGVFELVETVIHTQSPTEPSSVDKHSSINDTNLLHTEGYAQHHDSANTNFDSHVEGQDYTEEADQSNLDDHELADINGEKAEVGVGVKQ